MINMTQPCVDVFPQIKSLVLRNLDAAFPMGNYTLVSDRKDDYIWAGRLTFNQKYTDDIIFEL